MNPLRLDWSPAARRDLKRLPAPDRERVLRTVKRFEQSGQGDVVKLTGVDPPEYRLRVGPWRVRFEWDGSRNAAIRRKYRLALSTLALLAAVALPGAAVEYAEIVKLAPEDLRGTDFFGRHLALSGDRLAVASEDWDGGTGAVYVFQRHQGGSNAWGLAAKVLDPTPEAGEHFGYSVDLEGSALSVVAAFGRQPGIRVFELASRGRWQLTADRHARVYASTAISSDTIVAANSSEKRVDVFLRDGGGLGAWSFLAALRPSDGGASQFAHNVVIDGGVVVAGAYSDDELAEDAGSAYVWERDEAGNWQELEVAKLFASDGAEGDEFGRSVAVEGDLIAVGSPFEDAPLTNTGAVYLYRRDGAGRWNEIAKLVADGGQHGDVAAMNSIAISRGRVVVGALGRDAEGVDNVGAILVFEQSTDDAWHHAATLQAADQEEFDELGTWVGVSGGTIVASTPADPYPIATGAAYVFQRVASPAIDVSGSCPGEVNVTISGATPGGAVVLAGAPDEGLTDPPGEACPDVELGLEDARIVRRLIADSDGRARLSGQVGLPACGWSLQPVDVVTCGVGAISRLP